MLKDALQILSRLCVGMCCLIRARNMCVGDVSNDDTWHVLSVNQRQDSVAKTLVELRGIEPLASSMPWRRSTN